jgi:hypothetical protein
MVVAAITERPNSSQELSSPAICVAGFLPGAGAAESKDRRFYKFLSLHAAPFHSKTLDPRARESCLV